MCKKNLLTSVSLLWYVFCIFVSQNDFHEIYSGSAWYNIACVGSNRHLPARFANYTVPAPFGGTLYAQFGQALQLADVAQASWSLYKELQGTQVNPSSCEGGFGEYGVGDIALLCHFCCTAVVDECDVHRNCNWCDSAYTSL